MSDLPQQPNALDFCKCPVVLFLTLQNALWNILVPPFHLHFFSRSWFPVSVWDVQLSHFFSNLMVIQSIWFTHGGSSRSLDITVRSFPRWSKFECCCQCGHALHCKVIMEHFCIFSWALEPRLGASYWSMTMQVRAGKGGAAGVWLVSNCEWVVLILIETYSWSHSFKGIHKCCTWTFLLWWVWIDKLCTCPNTCVLWSLCWIDQS